MTPAELAADLRTRINPAYAAQLGTESYERRLCAEAIEGLVAELASIKGQEPVGVQTMAVLDSWEQWAFSTGLDERNHDLCDALEAIRASCNATETALLEILSGVQRYLRPDGISKDDLIEIVISRVDPWPAPAQAQAGAQPYDQRALELCEECGWKAVMPGEPCLVCERNAKFLSAGAGAQTTPSGYQLVPIEPTIEMMMQMPASANVIEWKEYYKAMLAAAKEQS